ncbi:uncharacterized protein LOC118181831 [Stegodyphus dumicola]|uniref:uncharacterized protein LOC118181831 n=1 Tax=Stegodyphus dumicola TaxID=202533 RepID=UPI0015B31619|nr:uncharacterized protein LOC118181831 [Stegodyphus dumicola]
MGALITTPITILVSLVSTRPSDIVFWCKWLASYTYASVQKRVTKGRLDVYDMELNNEPYKVGFLAPPEEVNLESPMSESHLLMGADEVFFYGVNSHTQRLVVRIARGSNHESEAWIYLKLADDKIFELKETSSYQQSCCDKRAFTCGGLQVYHVSPMRRWRIFFNGLLRQTSENDSSVDKMVHVKFALRWRASSDIFDFTTDVNTAELSRGLAKAKWKHILPPISELYDALNFYAQTGTIMGTIEVDPLCEGEGIYDSNLYLFGERLRFLSDTTLVTGAEFCHVLGHDWKDGKFVHLGKVSVANIVKDLKFGFFVQPNGQMSIVSNIDLQIFSEERENDIKAVFQVDDEQYNLKGQIVSRKSHFESKKGWDGFLSINIHKINRWTVVSNPVLVAEPNRASGVVIKGTVLRPSKRRSFTKQSGKEKMSFVKVVPPVVHFSDEICQEPDVSGGKGSSLGKLTQLSKDLQNFIVPNGIVVTTSAYAAFITKDILKEIKNLEDVLYGRTSGDTKKACQRVIDEVVKTNIPDTLLQAIVKTLQKVFQDNMHTLKFAVRSSATGEDTEQMSAAGQMETFLGVTGLKEILSAVKKCWASQFSFIAVHYKRQNGQMINSPMAVVIQEMVPCDVAGVLFTCDPLTGNTARMSITANYGLGESVVSGSEEPDTIELQRDADDNLVVKNKSIGSKSRRIIIKDDEGTQTEDVPENERQACCLSDEMVLKLGRLAIKIEKYYRSHRDIEWGFWNKNLYIFQSRPVTSGTGETDYEIEHEFDAPMRVENEYFTVCNVGEVMPGAMTPLGMDTLMKFFNIVFKRRTFIEWQSAVKSKYFPKGMASLYNHTVFYAIDLMEHISEGRGIVEAAMIGLYGRIIDDDDMFEMAMIRYGKKKRQSFLAKNFKLFLTLTTASKRLKEYQKAYVGYRIPVENFNNSKDLFDFLLYSCSDLCGAMQAHMICSQTSSMWNMFLLSILRKAAGELNANVYCDFAQFLATSGKDVESADVPSAIQNLAFHIANEINPEAFKNMSNQEISHWLETSPSVAGIKFRDFLQKHGHRCLKEFDIHSTTWGTNPESLITHLKNLAGNVKNTTEEESDNFNKLISKLSIPLGYRERMILKFLLPRSRNAVQNRESSKSLLIKGIDAWRKGYKKLASLMVCEGRIPEEELLYFMTLEEIQELLKSRNAKIISRATHRRRRYPEMDSYIFPEISKGIPVPVNLDSSPTESSSGEGFSMKGIPVSQGVTKGFVRVALTLEEASKLKPGEILLTYSTDIGWTPYFPALVGVVTELGGLISHGAVVSREYGLPCIAGLHGATREFRTGDYVLLDGNKGILQRLPKPEDS